MFNKYEGSDAVGLLDLRRIAMGTNVLYRSRGRLKRLYGVGGRNSLKSYPPIQVVKSDKQGLP